MFERRGVYEARRSPIDMRSKKNHHRPYDIVARASDGDYSRPRVDRRESVEEKLRSAFRSSNSAIRATRFVSNRQVRNRRTASDARASGRNRSPPAGRDVEIGADREAMLGRH